MKVLVTGSQGLVGRYCVARWLAADPNVAIIGCGRSAGQHSHFTHGVTTAGKTRPAPLNSDIVAALSDPRYRYVVCDLLDPIALIAMLSAERPDIVVHLASGLRDDPTEHLLRTNVIGTENLIDAVHKAQLRLTRIVIGSSGSVYGPVDAAELPMREETPPRPFDMYSISKVAQENVALMLGRRYDLQVDIARIFNVIGPGQDERHLCGHLAAQLVAMERGSSPPTLSVGPLDTTRDLVDVRDVADGLRVLGAASGPDAIYNLASGHETRMQDVLDRLAAMADLPAGWQIDRKPGRKVDMARNVAAIDRLRALGYRPAYGLEDSLADILAYYRGLAEGALA